MSKLSQQVDYGKLRHVLIGAIRQLLYERLTLARLTQYYASHFRRNKPSNIKKTISKLSKDQLISFISKSVPEITSEDVNQLYEDFYYGARPKFQLYLLLANSDLSNLEKKVRDAFNGINREIDKTHDHQHPPSFRSFELDEIAQDDEKTLLDIKFKYQARHSYIEPEREENLDIFELRHSFAWINTAKRYCAIHSGLEKTAPMVADALKESGARLSGIKFTREILDSVFELDQIQRASYYKGNPGQDEFERVRISDPKLGNKMKLAKQYEDQYVKTGALYREKVSGKIESFVGVVRDTGEIYVTRTLRTSQLRSWGYRRFAQLVDAFWQMQHNAPREFYRSLDKKSLKALTGVPENVRQCAIEIAHVIKGTQNSGTISKDLSYEECSKYFWLTYSYHCEKCENRIGLSCPECGSSSFWENEEGKTLTCQVCEHKLRRFKDAFICQEGHTEDFATTIDEMRVLAPKEQFMRLVEALMEFDKESRFETSGFYLVGKEIFVSRNRGSVLLSVSDFPEMKAFAGKISSSREVKMLDDILCKLPEKAKGVKTKKDFDEYSRDGSIRCLMKVLQFALEVDVQPHHGHEFGDLAVEYKLDGRRQTIQGICKKYRKNKINSGENLGENILRQAVQGLMNSAVDVIAIVTPTPLDDGLRGMVISTTKNFAKKVMFWDIAVLRKMLKVAMKNAELQPWQVLKQVPKERN
jgi:hypothetical protein